jgi:GT2 family glycosyltransferase
LDEIIVVDNASADPSVSRISEDSTVRLIRFQHNQGFARAANIGIEATKSRYVLLINPDVQIVPEVVRSLWGEMERRPLLGISCAALFDEKGESQESFQIRTLPTISSVIADALFIDEVFDLFSSKTSISPEGAAEVEQPAAAFWFMRRDTWKQIGGFDESFFPAWFEDVDFCKRLQDTSWRIMFFPHWQIIHSGGVSLENLDNRRFIEIYYSNLLKYWKKHHRWSVPLIWLPVRIGIFVRRAFAH